MCVILPRLYRPFNVYLHVPGDADRTRCAWLLCFDSLTLNAIEKYDSHITVLLV